MFHILKAVIKISQVNTDNLTSNFELIINTTFLLTLLLPGYISEPIKLLILWIKMLSFIAKCRLK